MGVQNFSNDRDQNRIEVTKLMAQFNLAVDSSHKGSQVANMLARIAQGTI
jgi:hypothetical protein